MYNHEKVDSEASAQLWSQHVFSLLEESEKEIFDFLKLLWGRVNELIMKTKAELKEIPDNI